MIVRAASRWWGYLLVVCTSATLVCIAYVDRPVATFVGAHLRGTAFWTWLQRALLVPPLVLVIGAIAGVGCGLWLASGRQLPHWTATPLLCCWGGILALAAEIILKGICGRTRPYPDYLQNHIYRFHFLHGGFLSAVFPSGTAAISVSIAAVLWIVTPKWGLISSTVAVILCCAVVLGNHHWFSDLIAGAFLGAFIGWSTVRFGIARIKASALGGSDQQNGRLWQGEVGGIDD